MFKLLIFLIFFEKCYTQSAPNTQSSHNNYKNSYYFRLGRNNNELKVNNRIYFLNHNISDYSYPNGRIEQVKTIRTSVNKVMTTPTKAKFKTDFYLDEEWDYEPKNYSRSDLPLFIQKFYNKIKEDPSATYITRVLFNSNRDGFSSIIKFDLDNLGDEEFVIDADLYFYWPLKNTSDIYKQSVVLRLYQFERQDNGELNEDHLIQNPDIHKLFNVIYVSKAQKGWQTFKLKKPIDNWKNGEENLGLLLTISSYDDNKLVEVFNDTNDGVLSTFAVIKVQKNDTGFEDSSIISSLEPSNSSVSMLSSPQCIMFEWTINFSTLGWDNFIIYPQEFTTFDCMGKCLDTSEEDINHVKLLEIFRKRTPCCVPVGYDPLLIMYFDSVGNVVIKNYRGVIVTACGCR